MRYPALVVLFACLAFFASPALGYWCADQGDYIYAEVDHGTITIHHDAAFYNCCPDSIAYTWQLDDHLFTVVETEYNPQCMCMCCFDLTTSMLDVAPGDYQIDFQWLDMAHGPQHVILEVTVPDEGQQDRPTEGPFTRSACIQQDPNSGVGEAAAGLAVLFPAQPNPVTDGTAIRFQTAAQGRTVLAVFSSAGRLVRTLVDEDLEAGGHSVLWDGRGESGARLAPGVYFCALTSAGHTTGRSLLLLR